MATSKHKLQEEGCKDLIVDLNGVARRVPFAHSFADALPGRAFIYAGSSGAVGPNPQRSRRYIELSCNGSQEAFGVDLFTTEANRPFTGQKITSVR